MKQPQTRTPSLSTARRRLSPHPAALGLVVGLVSFGACRTNIPDEVFYDGVQATGGTRPAGGSAPNAGFSVGGASGSTGGTSGTTDPGDPPESSAGAPASSPEGGAPNSAGGSTGDPEPEPPEPEVVPSRECGPRPQREGAFSREALRRAAVDCASWHFCEFENTALALDYRVQRYVTARDAATLTAARDAWKAAMAVWSRVELFQFGPLSSRSESAGKDVYHGQGLRELIYAWPSVARCRVEEQVATRAFAGNMDRVLISGRGLYGLEYLLFFDGSETACSPSSATARAWASLTPAELSERKSDYAAVLSADVLARIRAVAAAFGSDDGGYKQAFVSASGYPSEQEALNVLAWALVYVEREVKDWKLGVPAEYTVSHPVTEPESPFANVASENLRGNLEGFRSLFQGCGPNGEGIGFDDWLEAAGHGDLAADIKVAWQRARAAADTFPPYQRASKEEFASLYATLKGVTDLVKSELFGAGSPLNLKLPAGVEGDTD